jgi:hypothetical protein
MVAASGTTQTAKVSTSKLYFDATTGQVTAVDFNSTSDENLKMNIETLNNSIEILKRINPVSFEWKDTERKSYGVIAQELEKVLPELVKELNGTKSVSYTPLIALLINSIVELYEKVDNK